MQKMFLTRSFLDSVLANRVKQLVSRETIESIQHVMLACSDSILGFYLLDLSKGDNNKFLSLGPAVIRSGDPDRNSFDRTRVTL